MIGYQDAAFRVKVDLGSVFGGSLCGARGSLEASSVLSGSWCFNGWEAAHGAARGLRWFRQAAGGMMAGGEGREKRHRYRARVVGMARSAVGVHVSGELYQCGRAAGLAGGRVEFLAVPFVPQTCREIVVSSDSFW